MSKKIPAFALVELRQRLELLPERSQERRQVIEQAATAYGLSVDTLYRALRSRVRPKAVHRADRGTPRKISRSQMECYCELIAALKIRTSNKKGRHISTARAIELLEEYGMETPNGFVQPPKGLLTKSTVNYYLKTWGYDHSSMTRQPPAVRFQAESSNECWHFDLSPSDLKQINSPSWVEPGRGNPQLMLYSVVDDRSGACYQEYRCVYGENAEAALRFLFNAMSPKALEGFPFQGIPQMLYMDNGPIAKSQVFQNVMGCGKTLTLRRLQETLRKGGKILVSKSLSVDKSRASLATLIAALFYDLSSDKEVKIPSSGEKRERELRELIRKGKKPVALFVDEAHDLHSSTLTGLKRLIEVVEDGGGVLSIVLAGHPKLKNDLRRPTMEEIGYRTAVFSLDSIGGCQSDYIEWLLKSCTAEGIPLENLITTEAIDVLATRLRTPLQIEQHLSLAFEESYRMGEKPVTATGVESILSKRIDDLEPVLTRHGYNVKSLSEQFNATPAEIRSLIRGQLDPMRTRELHELLLAAGLPV
jgi:type II secretory pathway predicted ATPase ExeA